MKGILKRAVLPLVFCAAASLLSPAPFACGPFVEPVEFTRVLHPEPPIEDFVGGKLGILQPTYARMYLYVAYRHLAGAPFTGVEKNSVMRYWPSHPTGAGSWQASEALPKDWIVEWGQIEREVLGKEKPDPTMRNGQGLFRSVPGDSWASYLNCPQDAFQNAVQTYQSRKARYGEGAPLLNWVQGQKTVFSNCGGYQYGRFNPEAAAPNAPPPGAPEWLLADRQYQTAAALFYSQQYDAAAKQFDEIAGAADSPWQDIAPYLAARAFARKGTVRPGEGELDTDALREAERRLVSLIGEAGRGANRTAAKRLLNFVRFRTDPTARLHELAKDLQDPASVANRPQDMTDYKMLLDKIVGDSYSLNAAELAEARNQAFLVSLPVLSGDSMTEWIAVFQSDVPAATNTALQRWQATRSLPWLVATLSKIHGDHSAAAGLLAEADRVPAESPAFATVAFHAIRLLMARGQIDEARKRIDGWLEKADGLPRSSRNLLRAARLRLAQSLEEFARFGPRVSYGSSWPSWDPPAETPGIDVDFAATFNHFLPLEELVRLSKDTGLPQWLHREVALATWTRAVLLGRHDIALQLTNEVHRVAPETKYVMRDYRAASGEPAREHAVTYALLSFPGLRPFLVAGEGVRAELGELDHFRNNWWCNSEKESGWNRGLSGWHNFSQWESWPLTSIYPQKQVDPPAFLTEADLRQAARERELLAALPSAPNYLARRAAEWATEEPGHPLAPEALHRAVTATRWGCTDKETGQFSKRAFEILHSKYPNSDWAKKTKYWYGNEF